MKKRRPPQLNFPTIFFLGIALLTSSFLLGQELYVPRSVKKAYAQDTRSKDGQPGKNYWQNGAEYKIEITLTPPNRKVRGVEWIHYHNNSPDTLQRLNFKLFLNQHRPGAPRQSWVSKDYLTSGMHIDSFWVNGDKRKWEAENAGTNKWLKLKNPLPPEEDIHLKIKWHYKLSKQSGREGVIDNTTFFLAYFYPRIAVYDDYIGWDRMTFTGAQEFYNDFNDYTLIVHVPEDFIVWATGRLQNPKEVLQEKYYRRLEKSKSSDRIMTIAGTEDLQKAEITANTPTNTWKWTAENITDMAFAVSDHYIWDAGSVVVNEKTGRRVSVQAAYDKDSKDFQRMVEFSKHAIKWFSENLPGLPYPYPKMTVVRGFADMEYPMMANDNSRESWKFTRFVVEHEIAHTYFPFYMGTNQTRFGFMDEGWATALEYLIGIEDLGKAQAAENFKAFRVRGYINDPSMARDIPIITPSNILSDPTLGTNEYGKAALAYLAMQDLLGKKEFKKCLQGYMERWHEKHPTPWDFFYSFNDISGKSLNWFWKSWFFERNYMDYGIQKARQRANQLQLTLINTGGMPTPVNIEITFKDNSTKSIHQTPIIWKENLHQTELTFPVQKEVKSVRLDGGIWMDANLSDNVKKL